MKNITTKTIRRSLAISLMTSLAGCASSQYDRAHQWSAYARDIANQRMACLNKITSQPSIQGNPQNTDYDKTLGDIAPICKFRELALTRLADDAPQETLETKTEKEVSLESAEVQRGPLPGFRETVKRDLMEAPGVLWEDTQSVYTNPWNLLFLTGAGGASLALRPRADDCIEDYYDEHHTMSEDWRDAFGALGNPITHFTFAGLWYTLGQRTQDAKTYEVGKRMISALTITGISTVLLKTAACTESPNGEDFAWPSGHTSSTMALATVLNHAYGPLVGIPMFGQTGMVALERLDDREHHFSDVIFGAALGWVVAETVMKEHRPEIFGGEIVPYVDPVSQNSGIAWVKTLGN